MVMLKLIAGCIGVLAALGFLNVMGHACDRYDRWMYRRQQLRRVLNHIRSV